MLRNSLGQFSERSPVSIVCQFLICLELLPASRWLCRGDDQLFAVGTDFERSLGIDIKKIQNRTVNHQR